MVSDQSYKARKWFRYFLSNKLYDKFIIKKLIFYKFLTLLENNEHQKSDIRFASGNDRYFVW